MVWRLAAGIGVGVWLAAYLVSSAAAGIHFAGVVVRLLLLVPLMVLAVVLGLPLCWR